MTRQAVIGYHMSSKRNCWWHLEQDDDGSLFVRYENDYDHSEDWRKPLHEVLAGGGSAPALVQKRIDRMFEKRADI